MAKVLKSVVHNMNSKFNSRSNDIDGYWAVGVIFYWALESKIDEIDFDLMIKKTNIPSSKIQSHVESFQIMLTELLKSVGMSLESLNNANIKLKVLDKTPVKDVGYSDSIYGAQIKYESTVSLTKGDKIYKNIINEYSTPLDGYVRR